MYLTYVTPLVGPLWCSLVTLFYVIINVTLFYINRNGTVGDRSLRKIVTLQFVTTCGDNFFLKSLWFVFLLSCWHFGRGCHRIGFYHAMVGLCVLSRVLMISLQADIFFTNNLAVYGFRRGRIFFPFLKKMISWVMGNDLFISHWCKVSVFSIFAHMHHKNLSWIFI
jgi:hypothetical protein